MNGTTQSVFESMQRTDRALIDIKLYEIKLQAQFIAALLRQENRRGLQHFSTNLLNGYGFDLQLDD